MQLFVSINTTRIYHECEDGIKNIYQDIRKKKKCKSYRTHNAVGKTDKSENSSPLPPTKQFFVCVCGGGGGGYKKNLGGIKISEKLDMYYSLKGG